MSDTSEPRVLANLCSIVPGRVGGSEHYATRLLSAATHPQRSTSVATPQVEAAAMRGTRGAHDELAHLRWHEAPVAAGSRAVRVAMESSWLTRLSRAFDLVHHFGGRLPARLGAPAVLTIHDIQSLELPGNFSRLKRAYLARALPRSVRRSRLVTVPSQWVAARVAERFEMPPERICVVHSTASSTTDKPDVAEPRSALPPELQDLPFVLYPAATYPHKNHETLLAAHAAVWERWREPLLVLIGEQGRAHAEVMQGVAATPGATHLGWVSEELRASLVANAAAVAFPSRYEGFGLPVLEAMSAATPVVASSATAIPEVLGDGGTLVDPDDLGGWIDALSEVRDGSPRIEAAVARGLARAEIFSTANAASKLTSAWQQALTLSD